ncbi:hypothetical protein EMCRGX_G003880 [Ephydatia muelleri]
MVGMWLQATITCRISLPTFAIGPIFLWYGLARDHVNSRPADVLVQGWDGGKPAAYDITVASLLTPVTLNSASASTTPKPKVLAEIYGQLNMSLVRSVARAIMGRENVQIGFDSKSKHHLVSATHMFNFFVPPSEAIKSEALLLTPVTQKSLSSKLDDHLFKALLDMSSIADKARLLSVFSPSCRFMAVCYSVLITCQAWILSLIPSWLFQQASFVMTTESAVMKASPGILRKISREGSLTTPSSAQNTTPPNTSTPSSLGHPSHKEHSVVMVVPSLVETPGEGSQNTARFESVQEVEAERLDLS